MLWAQLTEVATVATLRTVKSVGVKMLKNNLSRYLELVRQGEIVLITDRDEVIAELRLPSQLEFSRASPWIAFLEAQARQGGLRLARRKHSQVKASTRATTLDVQALLAETREDRFP